MLKSTQLTDKDKQDVAALIGTVVAEERRQHEEGMDWYKIPTATEYERMKKYLDPTGKRISKPCPKCNKGYLIVQVYHGNVGDSLNLVCRWGEKGCDFKQYVADDE